MIKIALLASIICIICVSSAYSADDSSSTPDRTGHNSAIIISQIHSRMDSESLSVAETLAQINANPLQTADSSSAVSSVGAMHDAIDGRGLSVYEMLQQVNANLKKPSRVFFHNFM